MNLPEKLPESGKYAGLFRWLNQLREAVTTLRPLPSHNVSVTHTRVGTAYVSTKGSDTTEAITWLLLHEVKDDYLICHSWDGETEGEDPVYVAKNPKLQNNVTEEELDGVDYEYTYTTTGAHKYVERISTNTDTSTTETQRIVPRYIVGDEIRAISSKTGIETEDAEPISLIDLNLDARAWAAQ